MLMKYIVEKLCVLLNTWSKLIVNFDSIIYNITIDESHMNPCYYWRITYEPITWIMLENQRTVPIHARQDCCYCAHRMWASYATIRIVSYSKSLLCELKLSLLILWSEGSSGSSCTMGVAWSVKLLNFIDKMILLPSYPYKLSFLISLFQLYSHVFLLRMFCFVLFVY